MVTLMARLMRLTGAIVAASLLSTNGVAQNLTTPDPAGAGFSAARLARIAPWYEARIATGALPGAVVAIARDGRLAHLQAIGTFDRAGKIPLKPDAIFWIASMTKPVTSVAAMMLVEDGKLDLNAPLSQYLPAFKDKPVGIERVAAKRPPTVSDLLRHTAGLTYPEEGRTALHAMYGRQTIFRRDRTLADFVASLAPLPLLHQPGEVWEYSWSTDVLARVVEVVSGQAFDEFLDSRIFKPLGMIDTAFHVPPDKLARLVDPIAGGRPSTWDVTKPAALFSGGGGLVSTAPDYLRFCQMLLNGGTLDGVRLLSAATVRQMTTNTLPADMTFAGAVGQFVGPRVGTGWGLGFAVRTNPEFSFLPGAVGSFNWSGAWGTYFWVDPAEKLIGVQMIQVPLDSGGTYRDALRHLTYAALAVPRPSAVAAPPAPGPGEALDRYVGTYDFGRSLSARDRQAPIPAFTFAGTGLDITTVTGKTTVREVISGGPADRAGVRAANVISHVDDVPLEGLGINQVIEKLRGPAGKSVRLTIVRKDQAQPIDITIVRDIIRPPGARIEVRLVDGALQVIAVGPWPVLDIEKDKLVPLKRLGDGVFGVEGGDDTRLAFAADQAGKITAVVLNPGPAEIKADRIK